MEKFCRSGSGYRGQMGNGKKSFCLGVSGIVWNVVSCFCVMGCGNVRGESLFLGMSSGVRCRPVSWMRSVARSLVVPAGLIVVADVRGIGNALLWARSGIVEYMTCAVGIRENTVITGPN